MKLKTSLRLKPSSRCKNPRKLIREMIESNWTSVEIQKYFRSLGFQIPDTRKEITSVKRENRKVFREKIKKSLDARKICGKVAT